MNVRKGQKILINGANLYFEKVGRGDHVLLLIPGALGSTKTDFAHQLEKLNCDKFTMICFDPRGCGKSRPPERSFTSDYWHKDADDGAALMKKLGFPRYSVLGWSDGGVSAAILASRHIDRLRKLVIWGAASYISKDDANNFRELRAISDFDHISIQPYVEVYGKKMFKYLWQGVMDVAINMWESGNSDIFSNDASKIRAETLIIHGEKDAMAPKFHAEYLHECIKGSRLVCWEDGRHNLHIRHADRFNKLVQEFLLQSMSHL